MAAAMLALLAGAVRADERAAPPATPAPVAEPLATAAQAAQKVLRVATSGDYAPFSFETTGDAPSLDGLDVEIANRFAKDGGYRVEIVRFRWPDLSKELAAASFDVAMSGVTVRPERSIAGRLSVPIAATQAVVLTWKGSGTASLQDLDRPGRRIAVNAGGHLEKVAHGFFRRADVLPIADNAAVRMALLDRTVDAVVTDNFEEKVWTAAAPDALRLGTLSDDRKACLLPAARAELAAELDRWLLAREADGWLAELRRRYIRHPDGSEVYNGDEMLQTAEPVAALAAAVRERLALMPFVYEAKKVAGKPIEDKSQEAAVLDSAVAAVRAEAAAVGRKAPDEGAVRALFEVLIEVGKDAQRRIAEEEARRRPSRKPPEGVETSQESGAADAVAKAGDASTTAGDAAEKPAEEKAPPRYTGPDLARDLRPAIARIGEKIARILVAMKEPVSARNATARLRETLAGQGVSGSRLEEMAEAIARLSSNG
jgi:cyclohexadienyl dehydratase